MTIKIEIYGDDASAVLGEMARLLAGRPLPADVRVGTADEAPTALRELAAREASVEPAKPRVTAAAPETMVRGALATELADKLIADKEMTAEDWDRQFERLPKREKERVLAAVDREGPSAEEKAVMLEAVRAISETPEDRQDPEQEPDDEGADDEGGVDEAEDAEVVGEERAPATKEDLRAVLMRLVDQVGMADAMVKMKALTGFAKMSEVPEDAAVIAAAVDAIEKEIAGA